MAAFTAIRLVDDFIRIAAFFTSATADTDATEAAVVAGRRPV